MNPRVDVADEAPAIRSPVHAASNTRLPFCEACQTRWLEFAARLYHARYRHRLQSEARHPSGLAAVLLLPPSGEAWGHAHFDRLTPPILRGCNAAPSSAPGAYPNR